MSRLKIGFIGSLVIAIALLGLGATAAFAHGETVKTDPAKGASLDAAPSIVTVDLSEPPADGSLFEVTDGCGRNAAAHVTAEGNKLIAHLEGGQPGRWKAAYRIVSAADGHPSDGTWSFTVEGDASCNDKEATTGAAAPSESPEGDTEDASHAEEDTEHVAGNTASDSDDGGFPLIPIVVGAVAVIGAAAFVRAKTT